MLLLRLCCCCILTFARNFRKASPIHESLVLHIDALTRNVHEGHLREIFSMLLFLSLGVNYEYAINCSTWCQFKLWCFHNHRSLNYHLNYIIQRKDSLLFVHFLLFLPLNDIWSSLTSNLVLFFFLFAFWIKACHLMEN